jgi:hypothetical protein
MFDKANTQAQFRLKQSTIRVVANTPLDCPYSFDPNKKQINEDLFSAKSEN